MHGAVSDRCFPRYHTRLCGICPRDWQRKFLRRYCYAGADAEYSAGRCIVVLRNGSRQGVESGGGSVLYLYGVSAAQIAGTVCFAVDGGIRVSAVYYCPKIDTFCVCAAAGCVVGVSADRGNALLFADQRRADGEKFLPVWFICRFVARFPRRRIDNRNSIADRTAVI